MPGCREDGHTRAYASGMGRVGSTGSGLVSTLPGLLPPAAWSCNEYMIAAPLDLLIRSSNSILLNVHLVRGPPRQYTVHDVQQSIDAGCLSTGRLGMRAGGSGGREHDAGMFTRDKVKILKTVNRLEPETTLVDVPAKPAEEIRGGEATVKAVAPRRGLSGADCADVGQETADRWHGIAPGKHDAHCGRGMTSSAIPVWRGGNGAWCPDLP